MLGSKKFDVTNALKRLPALPRDFFVTAILAKFKAIYPTSMIYNVSWRCNAKCVMCNNWLRPYPNDLRTDEVDKAFSSRLFSKISNLGLSGGEPFLRGDLPKIVALAVKHMPRLKKVTINTNGFATKRILKNLVPILETCKENDILLGVRTSIDGLGKIHEKIRGVPNALEKCLETFEGLKELKKEYFFNYGIAYTINPINVELADEMHDFCEKEGINIIYNVPRTSAAFLDNEHLENNVVLSPEQQKWVSGFFRRLVRQGSVFNGDVFLYHNYVKQYENGGNRTMGCPYQQQGIILNPAGELLYCEMSKEIGNVREGDPADMYFAHHNLTYRKEIKKSVCDTCLSPCMASVNAAHQILPYAKFAAELIWEKTQRDPEDDKNCSNGNLGC